MRKQFDIKRMARPRGRKGFTLTEVLVTLMIFSFLISAIASVMFVGNSIWQSNSVEVELQQDLRQAMLWMRNDMQQTGAASLDASIPINIEPDPGTYPDPNDDPAYDWTTYTSFSFQKVIGVDERSPDWSPDTTLFTRESDSGDPDYNDLERTVGAGNPQLIAENISQLQVRRLYDSSDVVEIALEAQKSTLSGVQGRTITLTLDFKIQLRN